MKSAIKLTALILMMTLYACASKVLPPPQWNYEKDAVQISLQADPMLNMDDGKPHTLHICIYQLGDPNGFNHLSGYESGLYKLLSCTFFDSSVVASKHLFINPGEKTTLVLDRAEKARYVGIAAGYYKIEGDRILRLMEIPVIVESKGFFKRTKTQRPDSLKMDLILGPRQITVFKRQ